MTNTLVSSPFNQETHDAFLKQFSGPAWFDELRQASWQRFQEMEWPARKNEEWMRTDYRAFKLDKYHPVTEVSTSEEPPTGMLAQGVLEAGDQLAGQCISYKGVNRKSHVAQKWADRGVLFSSLREFAQEHSDILQKHLMQRAFDRSYDRFAALHTAWLNNGAVLYVPRNVTVNEPFHILAGLDDDAVDMSHVLVILEEGAEATVMSEYASREANATGLHCGGIELLVGDRANLRFVNLQDWGHGAFHFAQQKAVVGRDATLQWTIGALGARLAKVNQQVTLVGEGANCQVNGTIFTEGTQQLTYNTLQHHVAPNCRSDFLYKAALQDRSRTVWRGLIRVDEAAQKTDGYQRNDNLLLSERARADSIPGLEISADDVRCTHGSTSGRVDEELIFYARCRGFTRKEAIRVIVTGFFQQVYDRVTIESVKVALGDAIVRRVRDYE